MTIDQIFNTILITGVAYGILFSIVIFLSKKRKGKPLLFLSLIVLFISLNNLQAWMIDMGYSSSNIYIKEMRVPWYFLCIPLFYVFLVHYTKIQKKVHSFLYTSLSIFVSMIIVRLALIIYTQVNSFGLVETKQFIGHYSALEEYISFIYTLFIFIFATFIFTKNKKWFEFVLKYDDLRWIKHFLIMALIVLVLWIVAIVRSFQVDDFNTPYIYYPVRLITTIAIYWIGFKGLLRYRVMEDRIVLRDNINKGVSSKIFKEFNFNLVGHSFEKPDKVSFEKQQSLFEKINSFVKVGKKYTDPYISLETLAADIKMSKGYLSFLINTCGKKNFSDYINEFRVDQVKKWILEDEFVNYTIESLGLESGFNSKSTFYTAFKKFTNMTPSQFKQKHLAT